MDFSGQESSGIKILLAFEQIAVYTDFCEITDLSVQVSHKVNITI